MPTSTIFFVTQTDPSSNRSNFTEFAWSFYIIQEATESIGASRCKEIYTELAEHESRG